MVSSTEQSGEDEPSWVRELDALEVEGMAGPLVAQPVVLIAADDRVGATQDRQPPGAPAPASDPLAASFNGRPRVEIDPSQMRQDDRVKVEGDEDPAPVYTGRVPPVLRSSSRLVLGRPEDGATFDLQSDYHRRQPDPPLVVLDKGSDTPQQLEIPATLKKRGPRHARLGPTGRTTLRTVQSVLLDRSRRLKREMD